jgi:hypothetical protein
MTLLTCAWVAIFTGLAIYGIFRKMRVSAGSWAQCFVLAFSALSFYIPYEVWQWLTLEIAGPGRHAATQMGYAAGENKRYLVKAFLNKGLAIDSLGVNSRTALDIACKAERRDLARYLIALGANLDLAPDCRHFPEFASRMKPPPPQTLPDTGLPKVPGTTVDVTAPDPRRSYAQPY